MDERTNLESQPPVDTSHESDQSLPLEHAGEGQTSDDPVEDASADSFPASDPPSFTGSASE